MLFWVGYLAILLGASVLKGMVPSPARDLVWGLASSAAILALTLGFLRRDGRGAGAIGLRPDAGSGRRLVAGLLVGLLMHAVYTLAVAAFAGPVRFDRAAATGAGTIVLALAGFLALSCMEELGFRGYPLRTLNAAFGLWPAQLLVAVAFGLSHVAFGWPWAAVVFGVMTGSLLFGMAAIASGGLALPIGLHAAWNMAGWVVGEKDGGPWRMVVAESAQARFALVSSACYVAVFLVATAAFWYRHHLTSANRRGEGGPAAA